MASIIKDIPLAVGAETAWALLRDPGAAHRAFPGALVDCVREGDDRVIAFANGLVARERIVSVDETHRRVAYAVLGEHFAHHCASMQILPDGARRSRFFWASDFLPEEMATGMRPLIEQGCAAFRLAAEAGP